jgi:Fe-S-cluster-containing dehydrogenase component
MSKYYIYQDVKRCIGCFSCESHCKTKNNLPIGPRFCQIIPVGPKRYAKAPEGRYRFCGSAALCGM